jgi:hypothetical protein
LTICRIIFHFFISYKNIFYMAGAKKLESQKHVSLIYSLGKIGLQEKVSERMDPAPAYVRSPAQAGSNSVRAVWACMMRMRHQSGLGGGWCINFLHLGGTDASGRRRDRSGPGRKAKPPSLSATRPYPSAIRILSAKTGGAGSPVEWRARSTATGGEMGTAGGRGDKAKALNRQRA